MKGLFDRNRIERILKTDPAFNLVEKTCKLLRSNNFMSLLVGGCVRDLILGKKPKDYDIATDATPDLIKKLFPKVIEVGISFGVCKVVDGDQAVEVTTLRKESGYQDRRHPDMVQFIQDVKEDASRRDFTVNAFYLDIDTFEIYDFFEGLVDLENKIIKSIGDPKKRFEEDNLRMLRAIRFSTQLEFSIDQKTFETIKSLAYNILNISWERIRDEFKLIITAKNRKQGLEFLDNSYLLQYILPELVACKGIAQPPEFHPEGDVFVHSLLSLEKLESYDFILSFATLLHDIGKVPTFQIADRIRFNNHDNKGAEMAEKVAERFKLSNKEKEKLVWLIKNHLIFKDIKNMKISKIKRLFNEPYYPDLELLYKADKLAANQDLSDYEYTINLRKSIPPIKPKPVISGFDLIELGLKPSPVFKKILNYITDLQLENKIKTKQEAIEKVRELINTQLWVKKDD